MIIKLTGTYQQLSEITDKCNGVLNTHHKEYSADEIKNMYEIDYPRMSFAMLPDQHKLWRNSWNQKQSAEMDSAKAAQSQKSVSRYAQGDMFGTPLPDALYTETHNFAAQLVPSINVDEEQFFISRKKLSFAYIAGKSSCGFNLTYSSLLPRLWVLCVQKDSDKSRDKSILELYISPAFYQILQDKKLLKKTEAKIVKTKRQALRQTLKEIGASTKKNIFQNYLHQIITENKSINTFLAQYLDSQTLNNSSISVVFNEFASEYQKKIEEVITEFTKYKPTDDISQTNKESNRDRIIKFFKITPNFCSLLTQLTFDQQSSIFNAISENFILDNDIDCFKEIISSITRHKSIENVYPLLLELSRCNNISRLKTVFNKIDTSCCEIGVQLNSNKTKQSQFSSLTKDFQIKSYLACAKYINSNHSEADKEELSVKIKTASSDIRKKLAIDKNPKARYVLMGLVNLLSMTFGICFANFYQKARYGNFFLYDRPHSEQEFRISNQNIVKETIAV